MKAVLEGSESGKGAPISLDWLVATSRATFAVLESLSADSPRSDQGCAIFGYLTPAWHHSESLLLDVAGWQADAQDINGLLTNESCPNAVN